MKKNILRLLCVTLLAGMAFASCEKENIKPTKYAVKVVSANEQMGKAYGGGEYDGGEVVRIWGTPEVGYQFDRWNDGNTENPRSITVEGDATYTAYFKAVGSDPDTNGGGGGETPGNFTASVVVDGTPYSGIALVSMGPSDNLFNLAVYVGETGPAFVTYILPRTGSQTLADGIQCFFYASESDFVETQQGSFPPYLTVPSAGCTYDVNVSAFDLGGQQVTLTGSGTMLDIASAEAGEPRLVPFMVSIEGAFQYPGTPSK
jgi:hypothetical protein